MHDLNKTNDELSILKQEVYKFAELTHAKFLLGQAESLMY
jgi:hypothetical protein